MSLNCLANVDFGLLKRFAGSYAARKIRNVRSSVILSLLKHNGVLDSHCLSSNPAAFIIDFRVPLGTSSPGYPGIVTTLL